MQESSRSGYQRETGQVTICKSQNKTRLSSKRFRSCFTNKPPDGATSGFARLLDKSSIVGMNINISTFFESLILKKHKSHSVLILYSQSEMCRRFVLSIIIFPAIHLMSPEKLGLDFSLEIF